MGNAATSNALALSTFDNVLWEKIMNLDCKISLNQISDNFLNINYFPNPAKDELKVTGIKKDKQNENIFLMNELGQTFYPEVISEKENELMLSLKNHSPGFYILTIGSNKIKFIIEK